MSNILDYIAWRGDLSFAAAPFNEVDNYIIAKIGTPDLENIVPAEGSADIKYVLRRFLKDSPADGSMGVLASKSIIPMLRKLPETVRFGSLILSDYAKRLDFENTEQFSALTVHLPDGTMYVSFRGTDDTLIAWKENFHMSIMSEVPAQRDALEYLCRIAEKYQKPLIVGGHSKGGNLAVYAASMAPSEIQDRIIRVYNNDGPGFMEDFIKKPGYLAMRNRTVTIVPQHSIVGTLLTQSDKLEVVESDAFGVAAHDGFTWQVLGDRFVRGAGLSRSSKAFDEAVAQELKNMDEERRHKLIDELFDALMSTGAVTLTDISESGLRKSLEIVRSLRSGHEVRRFVLRMLELMLKEYRKAGGKNSSL